MTDYNPNVAHRVFDIISKADDAEARVIGLLLADELYRWDVAANAQLIAKTNRQFYGRSRDQVAKQLATFLDAGGDPEEALAVAGAVAISKDTDFWTRQPRDANGHWIDMNMGRTIDAGRHATTAAQGFASDRRWNKGYNSELSGATDQFNRLSAGGELVQQIGVVSGTPKLTMAGAVANYAGQFGPEAEKVVGPSLRRIAYRYRGTERTPDSQIRAFAEGPAMDILRAEGREEAVVAPMNRNRLDDKGKPIQETTPDGKPKFIQAGKVRNPNAPLYSTVEGRAFGTTYKPVYEKERLPQAGSPDALAALDNEQKVYAMEQGSIRYFLGDPKNGIQQRIADPQRAELQRRSGRITPSEGILIDDRGKVAAQAVGYAEDHYLPFNLKNLDALKGGSYVRTRESGGLTTEDIYTGLLSGARAMTVVSNSGVFTLEFDDTLRGGRRYNDKAREMVNRYAMTLDAIQSQQVKNPARQMDARAKAKIREEVEDRLAKNPDFANQAPEMRDVLVDAEFKRELLKPHLSKEKLAQIHEAAKQDADSDREADFVERQMISQALEEKRTDNYKLDGEGYGAALDALKEQFPYYIADVKFVPKEKASGLPSSSIDYGYVKPKFIRPEGVLAGYYDPTITGIEGKTIDGHKTGKVTADRTVYQNLRGFPRSGANASPAPTTPGQPAQGGATPAGTTPATPAGTTPAGTTPASGTPPQGGVAQTPAQTGANSVTMQARYIQHLQSDVEEVLGAVDDQVPAEYATLDDYARAQAADRTAMMADPVTRNALDAEVTRFQNTHPVQQGQPDWSRNRVAFARRFAQESLSKDNLTKPEAPIRPLIVTDGDKQAALTPQLRAQTEQFMTLDDTELRRMSTVARTAYAGVDPADQTRRQTVQNAIWHLEVARALKEEQRNQPNSTVISGLNPLPHVTGAQSVPASAPASTPSAPHNHDVPKPVLDRATRLAFEVHNGQTTHADAEGELRDMLEVHGSHLPEQRRKEIIRDLMNQF